MPVVRITMVVEQDTDKPQVVAAEAQKWLTNEFIPEVKQTAYKVVIAKVETLRRLQGPVRRRGLFGALRGASRQAPRKGPGRPAR